MEILILTKVPSGTHSLWPETPFTKAKETLVMAALQLLRLQCISTATSFWFDIPLTVDGEETGGEHKGDYNASL